jgi:hypothetical protein
MILVDLNQVMISNLMVQIGGKKDVEIDENIFRHMILNSLRASRKKFNGTYGELVICCDDKNFWRRQRFHPYKANRKKYRQQSGLDWSAIFNTLNKVREEIDTHFPYKVVRIETAEADDVIGTICQATVNPKHFKQRYDINIGYIENDPILILSGDKDFIQLHRYPNVNQYDPVQKKWVNNNDPERYLIEHIAKGDKGDGVPNFISSDTVFIDGGRQKPLRAKYLSKLNGNVDQIEQSFLDEEEKRGWLRNRMLIDLDFIPDNIRQAVLREFDKPEKSRDKIFNYFVKHKLKHLMENISEF